MKLSEILALIESPVSLETDRTTALYGNKSSIPEKLMNHIVVSISSGNDTIVIRLSEPKKTKTLEDLGYSFESGV